MHSDTYASYVMYPVCKQNDSDSDNDDGTHFLPNIIMLVQVIN